MDQASRIESPKLVGTLVQLEPLEMSHVTGLVAVGLDERIWKWNRRQICDEEDMRIYVAEALEERRRGDQLPFAIRSVADDRIIGSTRYGNIDIDNHRVEIGWTWIAPRWQRNGMNREAKHLLLRHAFEVMRCVRVEFKTDIRNDQSRQALKGIGATEEGVLRKHIRLESGGYRDTIYYSILDDEWPAVKESLERQRSVPR